MALSAKTSVYGILGHPVRHSLSPAIYNPLFEKHGIDAVYVAFDVAPAHRGGLATSIRTLGLAGANLTVPLKADIVPSLDRCDAAVDVLGAANVVVHRDGQLAGYNTDASGFRSAFETDFGPAQGASVVVLGAGGAARAVAAGLAASGASNLTFLNRTVSRAEQAAKRFTAAWGDRRFMAAPLTADAFREHAAGADVVVQCTSGPGADVVAGFDVGVLRRSAVWCDINYWMDEPPLVDACRSAGLRVQTGLPMLVHQAVDAFEVFVGVRPDPADIMSRLS